ncbi:MAG: YmdB family metallophosphoesterase [Actinobacteria bacterium]|nr:MAG: YmdB family metallophosphoesterase [Actinomycetota bacterium]
MARSRSHRSATKTTRAWYSASSTQSSAAPAGTRSGTGSTADRCRRSTSAPRRERTCSRRWMGPSSASRHSSSADIGSARRSTSSRRTHRRSSSRSHSCARTPGCTSATTSSAGERRWAQSSTSRASRARHSPAIRTTPATTCRSKCAPPPRWRSISGRSLRILFLADVFATAGRRAVEERLPGLREELDVDVCIVNGENAADGAGITGKLADRLLAAGADAITLGNHAFRRDGIGPYLSASQRVVRPANAGSQLPGRGMTVVEARNGVAVAVINLLGQLFVDAAVSPWEMVDQLVDDARSQAPVVVVDFHAEATSEKVAITRWLDGRVTAVIGTHTHVQTNDARILPGGTAAVTDAGMTGPHDSVIGVEAELAIRRMRLRQPVRFQPAEGGVRIEGVVVDCTDAGRAERIELLRVEMI